MRYQDILTLEPGKRGGMPCIRGMRITLYDVFSYLAAGMTEQEILEDFPYLTPEDLNACYAFAANRERSIAAALLRARVIVALRYKDTITLEPGKRGGKRCIGGMRITVHDVFSYLAAGMTEQEVLEDFLYLTPKDLKVCYAYAAAREHSFAALHIESSIAHRETSV